MAAPVADEHPLLRRVTRSEIEGGNVFAILATLPGDGTAGAGSPAGVKALLVESAGGTDFILAATRAANSSVESYYDRSCKVTRRV